MGSFIFIYKSYGNKKNMSLVITIFFSISSVLCMQNYNILTYMEKNGPWILYEEHKDINIYMYDNSGPPIVKIEKTLDSSLSKNEIFSTILNIENYNNVLTDKKIYSEFVTVDSDTSFGYQRTKNYIPFVRNRHLIFKLYKVDDNRLEWSIIDNDNKLYDRFQYRRIKELEVGAGRWEFLELDDTNLLIHYLYIDPNMNIPSFILNKIMRNSAESVMEDVLNYTKANNK